MSIQAPSANLTAARAVKYLRDCCMGLIIHAAIHNQNFLSIAIQELIRLDTPYNSFCPAS